nr:hypothetical protein [uncultured archaeon]
MSDNKQKASWWIVIAFMIVPFSVSLVSALHVVSFFELSNYKAISIVLAVVFELGALSSLAGIVAMDKINKGTVWAIFILLTTFQMMGNTYYSYDTTTTKMITDSNLIKNFTELFGFSVYDASDIIFVKRIIAILSGAILPIISLCFLDLLMKYITSSNKEEKLENKIEEPAKSIKTEEEPVKPIEEPVKFIKTEEIPVKSIKEPSEPIKPIENTQEDGFNEYVKTKKEKLEKDWINYSELLKVLYKEGTAQNGEELPSYKDFVTMVDEKRFDDSVVKIFLTICNYLSITKVSGEQKIALMSYEDAKTKLEGYLAFGNI